MEVKEKTVTSTGENQQKESSDISALFPITFSCDDDIKQQSKKNRRSHPPDQITNLA
jgi:hypothetical protein